MAFDKTDGVFEGMQRAIQPAGLVRSLLNRAMEAARVQHCAVANFEMHHTETSRTRSIFILVVMDLQTRRIPIARVTHPPTLRGCRDATPPLRRMSLYCATGNRSLHSDIQRGTSNSAATATAPDPWLKFVPSRLLTDRAPLWSRKRGVGLIGFSLVVPALAGIRWRFQRGCRLKAVLQT